MQPMNGAKWTNECNFYESFRNLGYTRTSAWHYHYFGHVKVVLDPVSVARSISQSNKALLKWMKKICSDFEKDLPSSLHHYIVLPFFINTNKSHIRCSLYNNWIGIPSTSLSEIGWFKLNFISEVDSRRYEGFRTLESGCLCFQCSVYERGIITGVEKQVSATQESTLSML